jgi:uncharacterized zinc-type alcohol dehydrogenase-like protein
VCRSDLDRLSAPRPAPNVPIVPGHEIVGEIVQLGRAVSGLKLGTRVGIGWQSGSCGHCEWCRSGQEHLCADQEETCIGRSGGFASRIKVQARFAVPVPEGLDSAHAAPLLCAGIAVYSPLRRHRLHEGQRAAVVGIGGLGHLALQFLRALGCTSDAFSTSSAKAQDARSFGADGFFCLQDHKALSKVRSTYDFIVSTSPGLCDLTELLRMLRPRGTLCVVVPRVNLSFAADELIGFQKTIEGSPIGSPATIAEMFRFAVDRNVRPSVECFPMTDGNTALKRLADRQIRYRAVLTQDWS